VHTFPIIRSLVDEIVLVSESAIGRAMRWLAESARLVVEPSGAVSLAALLEHRSSFPERQIVVVISGGNLDMNRCQLGL